MKNKFVTKTFLFTASVTVMLIADVILGDTAEIFNLYYFLQSLTSSEIKTYMIFQEELAEYAGPVAVLFLIVIHTITANSIYYLYQVINKRRNNETR